MIAWPPLLVGAVQENEIEFEVFSISDKFVGGEGASPDNTDMFDKRDCDTSVEALAG